jgi:hypothetical protein
LVPEARRLTWERSAHARTVSPGLAARSVGGSVRRTVPLPIAWKARLKDWPPVERAWAWRRRRQVHAEYARRREYSAREAAVRGMVYREADVIAAVRARLRDRG